jgi:hypothetical protein
LPEFSELGVLVIKSTNKFGFYFSSIDEAFA